MKNINVSHLASFKCQKISLVSRILCLNLCKNLKLRIHLVLIARKKPPHDKKGRDKQLDGVS